MNTLTNGKNFEALAALAEKFARAEMREYAKTLAVKRQSGEIKKTRASK